MQRNIFNPLTRFMIARLFRITSLIHDPIYFGKNRKKPFRFDPLDNSFGVLYASRNFNGATIESVGRRPKFKLISESLIISKQVASIKANRPYKLADLTGRGLARLGLDASITCGNDYRQSRQISKILFDHPSMFDGILYRARHDPSQFSIALFERHDLTLNVVEAVPLVNHPKLPQFLRRYNFGIS